MAGALTKGIDSYVIISILNMNEVEAGIQEPLVELLDEIESIQNLAGATEENKRIGKRESWSSLD
jgi:hypothetical protein